MKAMIHERLGLVKNWTVLTSTAMDANPGNTLLHPLLDELLAFPPYGPPFEDLPPDVYPDFPLDLPPDHLPPDRSLEQLLGFPPFGPPLDDFPPDPPPDDLPLTP